MAGFQYTTIHVPARPSYPVRDVAGIIAAHQKAYDDIVRNNPVRQIKINTTSSMALPNGILSATPDPVTGYAPSPATQINPSVVANKWLTDGPSAEVKAQYGDPYNAINNLHLQSPLSFIGGLFHKMEQIGKAFEAAAIESGRQVGKGDKSWSGLGNDIASVFAGAKHGWEGTSDVRGSDLLHAGERTPPSDQHNLGWRILDAGANFGLDTITSPWNLVPLGAPTRAVIKGVKALGRTVTGKGAAAAGTAATNTATQAATTTAATQAAAHIPDPALASNLASEKFGSGVGNAGSKFGPEPGLGPEPGPAPTGPGPGPTGPNTSPGGAEIPTSPITPTPAPAAPVVDPAVAVTATATAAQHAAISDQLHNFHPPENIQTHITQTVEDVPQVPAVSQAAASETRAATDLQTALPTNAPVSDALYNTLASAETKAAAVVFHPTLGELDAPKLEFHIKQASTDYNAAYRLNARLRKEPLTPEITTQINNAQGMMKAARVQINELKKLKKTMPSEEALNGPRGVTNPSAQVKPEPVPAPEPSPELVNPPVEPITPAQPPSTAVEPSGPPSRPKAEIQADIDKSLVALQRATDRVNAAEERGNAASIAKANDNFDKIALQHETFRTEMENFREPVPASPAPIRDRAAIEADVARLKAESDKAQETLAKAYKSGDRGKIMNAQTRADMADEAHQAVEKELGAFKPVSEQLMPTPKQVTENQIAKAAHEKLVTGNHPPAPDPEVAKAAIAAERKIKPTDGRLAVNKFGRAKMAPERRDPLTGGKPTSPERSVKYAVTSDQARAYKEAYAAVLHKIDPNLVGLPRAQAVHELLQPMLQKHKLDSFIEGFDSRLSEDSARVTMHPGDYQLHHADVYDVAYKHETNPHFVTAESYEAARNTVVPQSSQLVAAVKALDLENAPMSHAAKIDEIVAVMRKEGENSTFKLEEGPLRSFAEAMVKGTPDLREKIAENAAGMRNKLKVDTQTVVNAANEHLDDSVSGINASNTTALHAVADLANNVHTAADAIGAHPAAAEAAAAGHGIYAAQQGIGHVEVNEARTILGNKRIIDSAMPNRNGSFSQGVRSKVDNRLIKQGRLIDAQTDEEVKQMFNMQPPNKVSPPSSGGGGGGNPPIPPTGGGPPVPPPVNPPTPVLQAQFDDSMDIGQRTSYRTPRRWLRAMGHSFISGVKRGDQYSGVETAKDITRKFRGRAEAQVGDIRKHLSDIRKEFDDPGSHQTAISALQQGTIPDPLLDPNAAAVYDRLKPLVARMYEVQANASPSLGTMFISGHSWDQINKAFDRAGVDKKLRFDPAKASGLPTHLQHDAIADQWKGFDLGAQPLTQIDAMYSAMASMKSLKDAALQMADYFGSAVKTATHNYLVHNSQKSEYLSQYLPANVYFPEHIGTQLGDIEAFLREGVKFGTNTAAGRAMNNVFIPYTNILKKSQTIWRPASSIRNGLGDGLISFMADGVGPKHYKLSMRIMSSVGHASKDMKDILASTSGQAAHATKDAMTITLKGKKLNMSVDDLRKLAINEGMYQSYHAADTVAEDLLSGGASRTGKLNDIANKLDRVTPLRKLSEAQDYSSSMTRIAHLNKLLSDPRFTSKFATLEEAAGAASSRVRLYHPDPGSLTKFESKWMRAAIPYYTFQRSIILPTVLSLVNNPKSFVRFVYAMEAANTVAGSNEGNVGNATNQWDVGTMRPDYITSNLFGAPGNMFGIVRGIIGGGGQTPGSQSVQADLGSGWENAFGATGLLSGVTHGEPGLAGALNAIPLKVEGQMSPAIQLGVAALTHKKLTEHGPEDITKANINDFLDQLIPGVNQLSNTSGFSATGTIANALTGNRTVTGNAATGQRTTVLAPQDAVLKGNKQPWFRNVSTLNMFSPVKFNDPNTMTNAQVALRQILQREGVPSK